jgi:hypothetical protein
MLIGAGLGVIAAILGIAFLVNMARKRNVLEKTQTAEKAAVQVQIATTPPAASVRINGEAKCDAPCAIPLTPGTYQVTAFLDGYDPATDSITVAAGQPANLSLTLTAQAQAVRILTDLDQGKVAFDDQPPADLQDGQLIVDKVAPGSHTVKVTGKSGEATFTFDIAEAKPPVVTGSVTAKNLMAVLVASFGNTAHVVTNSGPLKLALNGQPEGDAGPAGVDLTGFQAGVDELVIGDAKDQKNMKESFGPAPMLTAFLKSDLNIGTLIVSTGDDDVRVFLNEKEYRARTKRGQLRIQTIGKVNVRVAKDGFQPEPAQTAEIKKGAEVRLEFKLKAAPVTSTLQIRGGPAGADVSIDQGSIGTVNADGSFTYANVLPGDHVIELRRDQFQPKRLQRSFRVGQSVTLSGADVAMAATVSNGTIRIARTPANATITYRRADDNESRELRAPQVELPAGSYIFSAKAVGYADRTERVQLAAGETKAVDIVLTRERVPTPVIKTGDITDFEEAGAWKKEGDLFLHKGGGFVPYKLGPRGVYTFTVELVKGGSLFRGGRIRWAVQYVDAKNYLSFELDRKTFWAYVTEKGKRLERQKTPHQLENPKSFTISIEITPDHVVHKLKSGDGWLLLDTFAEPGRNFTDGKFGFLIQGSDEIGISNFTFSPQ